MKIRLAISTQSCGHPAWMIFRTHGPSGMKYGDSIGAGNNSPDISQGHTGIDSSNSDGWL